VALSAAAAAWQSDDRVLVIVREIGVNEESDADRRNGCI
jgi:hypothetical protein